jgi:glutamate/aspartate transport system substrate-binding protein
MPPSFPVGRTHQGDLNEVRRQSRLRARPRQHRVHAAGAGAHGHAEEDRGYRAITIGHRESSIPFSYLDDKQQPVGYAMDLCMKVVEAVKAELKMPNLKVNLSRHVRQPDPQLKPATSTWMRLHDEQLSAKQVSFGPVFVINVTAAVKKSRHQAASDLQGKTISTTSGTTSVPLLKQYEKTKSVNIREIYGKDHAESFLLLSQDRSAAFVMDDILLAGQIANSGNPGDFMIIPESLRQEPYSMMLRKDDPQFKALVDRTVGGVMKSREINAIYAKWFTSPIPPKGVNMNFPMTPAIRDVRQSRHKGVRNAGGVASSRPESRPRTCGARPERGRRPALARGKAEP